MYTCDSNSFRRTGLLIITSSLWPLLLSDAVCFQGILFLMYFKTIYVVSGVSYRQTRIGALQIQSENLCLDWVPQSSYI